MQWGFLFSKMHHFLKEAIHQKLPTILPVPGETLQEALKKLQELNVNLKFDTNIHKNDIMFLYALYNHKSDAQALFSYFNEGFKIANRFKAAADDMQLKQNSILDFGSGYGRVSRFLPHVFPTAELYASEVKHNSLVFLEESLRLNTLQQTANQKQGVWPKQDLILALSVFTHLPKNLFISWLKQLVETLNPGGALFFTFKGMKENRQYLGRVKRYFLSKDFVYLKNSEDMLFPYLSDANQKIDEYGVTYVSNMFIKQQAQNLNTTCVFYEPSISNSQQLCVFIKK